MLVLPSLLLLGILAQSPSAPASKESATRPRSVVFYLMDTTRNDRMGYGGYSRETTPFLSWLAERSVVFEACYSQAPWTKPSMAALLTSHYPSTAAAHRLDYRLPNEFLTLPEVLQANDMYTAGFSANIVMGNLLSNYAQGFDHFVESTEINHGDPIRFASGSAAKLNARALPWLAQDHHWPKLLYLHSVDPHEEYQPASPYLERFADRTLDPSYRQDWKKLLASRPPIPGLFVTQDNFDRTGVDSTSFIHHGSNLYDADILANDDQLKLLWNALQEQGWGEDMVFVFTSDHGEEFFEHGGTSHGYSLYEEMTRVPLMIYAPGLLPAGKRIHQPVRSIDIYPTLCELLGYPLPHDLEGESLLPLIRGQETTPREIYSIRREDPSLRALGQSVGSMVSLREGTWRLILNLEPGQLLPRTRLQLFDLSRDPSMRRNLATTEAERAAAMEHKVLAFVAKHWGEEEDQDPNTLDPAVRAQLEALGYLASNADQESDLNLWPVLEIMDLAQIEARLQAGAHPEQRDAKSGITPLTLAALLGHQPLADLLLAQGAQVDTRNRDGSTPLAAAAFLGRSRMVARLLAAGADPAATNLRGESVLHGTRAPWELTRFIAGLLQIEVVRPRLEAGRRSCARLLRQALDAREPLGSERQ